MENESNKSEASTTKEKQKESSLLSKTLSSNTVDTVIESDSAQAASSSNSTSSSSINVSSETLPSPFICSGRQFHLQAKEEELNGSKRELLKSMVERRLASKASQEKNTGKAEVAEKGQENDASK